MKRSNAPPFFVDGDRLYKLPKLEIGSFPSSTLFPTILNGPIIANSSLDISGAINGEDYPDPLREWYARTDIDQTFSGRIDFSTDARFGSDVYLFNIPFASTSKLLYYSPSEKKITYYDPPTIDLSSYARLELANTFSGSNTFSSSVQLTGLTASAKANILYYDTANGRLSYSTPPVTDLTNYARKDIGNTFVGTQTFSSSPVISTNSITLSNSSDVNLLNLQSVSQHTDYVRPADDVFFTGSISMYSQLYLWSGLKIKTIPSGQTTKVLYWNSTDNVVYQGDLPSYPSLSSDNTFAGTQTFNSSCQFNGTNTYAGSATFSGMANDTDSSALPSGVKLGSYNQRGTINVTSFNNTYDPIINLNYVGASSNSYTGRLGYSFANGYMYARAEGNASDSIRIYPYNTGTTSASTGTQVIRGGLGCGDLSIGSTTIRYNSTTSLDLSQVPLRNATNTFTGSNTFSGELTATTNINLTNSNGTVYQGMDVEGCPGILIRRPNTGSCIIDFSKTGDPASYLRLQADTYGNVLQIRNPIANTTPFYFDAYNQKFGIKIFPSFELDVSGSSRTTTGAWITSDSRVKTEIGPVDYTTLYDIVKNLPLRRFTWNYPDQPTQDSIYDRSVCGFFAQDVKNFFPKAIHITDETERWGIADFHNLDSDQIFKALYGTVQVLIEKTESMKETIDAQQAQINTLVQLVNSLLPST